MHELIAALIVLIIIGGTLGFTVVVIYGIIKVSDWISGGFKMVDYSKKIKADELLDKPIGEYKCENCHDKKVVKVAVKNSLKEMACPCCMYSELYGGNKK